MSDSEGSSASTGRSASLEPPVSTPKKRKRESKPVEEIEVDISAPEPPSKKALRKAKKGKLSNTSMSTSTREARQNVNGGLEVSATSDIEDDASKVAKRSDFGIWIGNLPFTATKADVRKFFVENSEITEADISRINLPPPVQSSSAPTSRAKPQNKGFAYIDFTSAKSLEEALGLSEALLSGRRVLIKNSKSFEGRPEKSKEDPSSTPLKTTKPPSKRIFVGNLGFEATIEDLKEHFRPCGEVEDVHLATFEDSGKCKGYAWVTFGELEGAEGAVRGWVKITEPVKEASEDDTASSEDEGDEDETKTKKKKRVKKEKKNKQRKWWVNRMKGRPLRMEFAEDKAVRYKKRFGKEAKDHPAPTTTNGTDAMDVEGDGEQHGTHSKTSWDSGAPQRSYPGKGGRSSGLRFERKVDARTIKPGAALANAPRLTGAIVEGKGKKITFD